MLILRTEIVLKVFTFTVLGVFAETAYSTAELPGQPSDLSSTGPKYSTLSSVIESAGERFPEW